MPELFVRDQERVFGPYSPGRINQLAAAGRITPAAAIGKSKEGPWVTAGSIQALFPAADSTPVGLRPSPGGAAKRSVGFTKLQWAVVATAALLPWLVAAVCTRPAAAQGTTNRNRCSPHWK